MKDSAYLKGFGRLATTLIALGVSPSDAFGFQRHVDKLVRCRSLVGAIAWLDSFGNLISNRLLKTDLPTPVWVSRHWLKIFKRCKSKELLQRLTKIKRCLISPRITAAQAKKFLDGVHRAEPDFGALDIASRYVIAGIESMRHCYPKNHNWDPPSALAGYVKREKSRGRSTPLAFTKGLERLQKDVAALHNLGLLDYSYVRKALAPLNLEEILELAKVVPYKEDEEATVGTVNVAQEPGGKARFSSSPRFVFHKALYPLQTWLMYGLHKLETDACYGARRALRALSALLHRKVTVYCYDLTSATCTFPAFLVWLYLRYTYKVPAEMQELFRRVAEGDWIACQEMIDSGYFDPVISWYVGQPLGVAPSFAAFSHAHHALIRGIAILLGRDPNCYYMIGDDVAIYDPEVAAEYESIQNAMGVMISPSKSMISNRVAEFGGATITRETYFNPGKWRDISDSSLMTFITEPSFKHERVTPPLWNRLIRRMRETPYPFGLFRPDLSGMDEGILHSMSYSIQAMFYRGILTPNMDEDVPDLTSDSTILMNFLLSTEMLSSLFPLPGGATLPPGVQRRNCYLEARARAWLPREDAYKRYSPSRLSKCFHFMQQETVLQDIDLYDQLADETLRRRISKDDLSLCADTLSLLDDRVAATFQGIAGLVHSILLSARSSTITPLEWVDSIPVLSHAFAVATEDPDYYDLVRAVLGSSPYYWMESLEPTQPRFVAVLRRYGAAKEVLPPIRTSLPRLSRG